MMDRLHDGALPDMQRRVGVAIKAASPANLQEPLGDRTVLCEVHGEFTANGMRYLGKREIWTTCPDCEEVRLAVKRKAEAQEQAQRARVRLEAMLGQAAIPKRFASRSLDSFVATTADQAHALNVAREFAENFEAHAERGDSLVLSGLPGTGKSHLATAIQHASCRAIAACTSPAWA
jgi:DNA replication protein DnaC